ncbi:MAG: lactate utilization protein, partial [Lachnospiraceae bacterium]|nr:lactate utilization protein [Lachnospiraceae bacterium]
MIPNGASIGVGGSESLKEIDAIQWIRKSGYDFFDRYAPELTREQALEVMRQALLADVFLTSTNAITEKGELYNVDGNGNRIAAFCYGPKRVIVIA